MMSAAADQWGSGIGAGLCAAAFIAFAPIQSDAGEWPPRESYEVHHDPTPGSAWFARIVVWNPDGSAGSVWQFPTSYGRVTMRYESSPNGCTVDPVPCSDRVTITDLPDGVIPSEWEADIEESTTHTIYLFKYLGG